MAERSVRGAGVVATRVVAVLVVVLATVFATLVSPAWAAGPPVSKIELKNAESRAVSVPLGSDNGVTKGADFSVTLPDGSAVVIYPVELYERLFWSQPLSDEAYDRIERGAPVVAVVLSTQDHADVRRKGEATAKDLAAKVAAAKREKARVEAASLREARERLADKRDRLDEKASDLEKSLLDAEGRMEWASDSEDRDIDRALQNIEDHAQRRDELQSQRDAASRKTPYPKSEVDSLTREISRLNDRIARERTDVSTSRDRKREAKAAYLERKRDWKGIVADRDAVEAEIKALDRKIRDLETSVR